VHFAFPFFGRLLEAAALAVSHNSASPPLQHASVVASASSAAPAAAGVVSAPGNTSSFQEIIRDIEREHLAAARAAISDKRHLEEVELSMASECQRLRSFLEATQVIGEMSPRSRDVVIGTGEKLSCLLLTAVLRDQVPCVFASYVAANTRSAIGGGRILCQLGTSDRKGLWKARARPSVLFVPAFEHGRPDRSADAGARLRARSHRYQHSVLFFSLIERKTENQDTLALSRTEL